MNQIFETPMYPYQRHVDQDETTAVHHPVIIIGAGPIGLSAAIDLAQRNVPVLVLDENDKVSSGSRAICFSKRTLDILDRLGCGTPMVDRGVEWSHGKVFFGGSEVYHFDVLAEEGHKNPAFINLQQYHLEKHLIDRVHELQSQGYPIEIRGNNRVDAIANHEDSVSLEIDTPDGPYNLEAAWLIACDGAGSTCRKMLGHEFGGRVFEDNFLIADVVMQADFPTERWFWFDPPFNPGQSALLHKQPDDVWRIDLQLGWDIDRKKELKPERIRSRVAAMLGADVPFVLEWSSIYTFQCRRMDNFRHGRMLFAGDSAHQVSPFGARGANSGFQDSDNLCWKLQLVLDGKAGPELLDSYDAERVFGADENIVNSTRSTDFITPKSETSKLFRDAVLTLSEKHLFARPMVNSGRLSVPCVYGNSALNTLDALTGPAQSRPGAVCPDLPVGKEFLLNMLGPGFTILAIATKAPDTFSAHGLDVTVLSLEPDKIPHLTERYLGDAASAVYLVRPDQHVVARFPSWDESALESALARAISKQGANA